ncbi:MAG: disulfide bond formation protein B [Gammaproteobacteria bacterium]|nr:disulfide bond formation protein B [Gammaproteobacteria bacterium]
MAVLDKLAAMGRSGGYWLALLLLGLAMEGMALFYQYRLDYPPCVLCIHVRIWLLGLMGVAALALWLRHYPLWMAGLHGLVALLMGGMLERSWQLLGTERGWIFGSCNMDAGLPDWFALDRWFPALFEVKEACGYTPELLFGVTMAEGLLLFSTLLALLATGLLLATLLTGNRR